MSDTPLNKEGSKLPSNIDLSIDINPEMYANNKPHPSYDKFYKAAEYATEQADYKATSEENGQKGFVTAKADGMMAGVYDWIRCIIFAIAIVVIVLTFVFRLVDVEGTSMCDTLQTKDKVIVTNLLYTPRDNDIVVISHGAEYKKPIIKRVIATEGQTLELDYENEKIIVDGIEISEPYIKGTTFSGNYGNNVIPSVIPEGKIFVMGDNRQVSLDSRSTEIGLIDVKDVIGKAQVVAFPFDHFGYLY